MIIGDWVARPHTKAHLVESMVSGDPIVKCGRWRAYTPIDLEPLAGPNSAHLACQQCLGRRSR